MPHPLFLRFMPGARDNTAAALRGMVLACPVPDEQMRSTPLFSEGPVVEGGAQKPVRQGYTDKMLRGLLLILCHQRWLGAIAGTASASASPALFARRAHQTRSSSRCADGSRRRRSGVTRR